MSSLIDPKIVHRMFVIETDAPCKRCGGRHEYVTANCTVIVYTDYATAYWIKKHIEGAAIREIEEVPPGIPYILDIHRGGKRDRKYPAGVSSIRT